jgi:ribosomal protein S27AE
MSEIICSNCGTIGKLKKITKGSFFIEVILWLCLIIPGVIYSIWRLTTKHKVCSVCGSGNLIPLNSPAGLRLQKKQA